MENPTNRENEATLDHSTFHPGSRESMADQDPETLDQNQATPDRTPRAATDDPTDAATISGMEDDTQALTVSTERQASQRSQGLPQVPHYEILKFLGSGTFGQVWLARDRRTKIEVAIKFFVHGSGGRWGQLQSEVQQLADLNADPGIVQLIDVEPDASPPYYVMDFVENGSLAQKLEAGPLPVGEALEIFRQIAEALAYVHAKGIRHCDLKPSNILLDIRGRARIADFGQAQLSSDASPALGTFFYMAPEQANLDNQIADTRWDVYALGAILYSMLTGAPPGEDRSVREEIRGTQNLSHRLKRYREWVVQSPAPRNHRAVPGMDRYLASIIERCLELNPERRLRDAGAVLQALERRRQAIRQRAMLGFGLIAPLVVMLALAGLTLWGADGAIQRSRRAMIEQLAGSDAVSARLAALVVEEEIFGRLELLKQRVTDPKLIDLLRAKNQLGLRQLMADYGATAQSDRIKVMRWTIADHLGTTQANYPWEASVCNKNWAWRDWFNGQGDHHHEKDRPFPPIDEPHISQPFVGKTNQRSKGLVLSAPVFEPSKDEQEAEPRVLGVLAMTIELEKIENWLNSVQLNDGFSVLIDSRYHCLIHKEADHIQPRLDQNPPTWPCPTYEAMIKKGRSDTELSFKDPVDGKIYLAGYAAMPRIGWGVVVQHDRDRLLAQVAEDTYYVMKAGQVGFIAAGVLISALWGWQFWTLRKVQRIADA